MMSNMLLSNVAHRSQTTVRNSRGAGGSASLQPRTRRAAGVVRCAAGGEEEWKSRWSEASAASRTGSQQPSPENGRMSGKTVLVAGAAGGCGRLTVQRLIAEGATVRGLVRDPQARSAQSLPAGCTLYRGDVYDYTTLPAGEELFYILYYQLDYGDGSAPGLFLSESDLYFINFVLWPQSCKGTICREIGSICLGTVKHAARTSCSLLTTL